MLKRTLTSVLLLAALVATSGSAFGAAADTVVVAGVEAPRIAALDGIVVWIDGAFPHQTLMQRNSDGTTAPVQGALKDAYFSIDLGHDARGDLVLTYARCEGTRNCTVLTDDLHGRRAAFRHLAPPSCQLTTAPSRWGTRVAYGLTCTKVRMRRRVADPARSGLFVRNGAGVRRRLTLPPDAIRFRSTRIGWVDLRGTEVGAGTTDVYSYAFTQTVAGTHLRSDLVAASEGDADASIRGQSLGPHGVLWTLVDSLHAGDPNRAVISRLVDGACTDSEALPNPPGPGEGEGYRAEAMAVDGSTVYLYVPGTGIVIHPFTASHPCA